MQAATLINLQGICKTYPKGIIALKSINLKITEREIVGIVGANGSGKSTLLKVIAGTLEVEQGSSEIFQLNAQKNTEKLKKLISYVNQDRALDPEMTGKEMLCYFSALYGLSGKIAEQRQKKLIDTFELDEFITRRVKTYSGGQAQRLHLAIGVIHQPKLLLLDEPTSALDPAGKSFFWDFIQSYQQQGNSIIIVSHELEPVRQFCTRVLLIDKGRLIANDTADNIIHSYAKAVLYIKTTSKLKQNDNIKHSMQQLFASADIQFKGQTVRLEIEQTKDFNQSSVLATILKLFQEYQLAVAECRWEEPSLENAYFNLTGFNISAPVAKNNKKKRKAR